MITDINKVLIVTDLDGTFLPTNKVLSPVDMKSVEDFTNMGGKFTIATGRAIQSVNKYLDDFNLKIPAILYNGGVIYNTKQRQCVYKGQLPNSSRQIVYDVLENFENVGVEILTEETIYVAKMNDFEKYHIKIAEVEVVERDISEIEDGWIKILFAAESSEIDKIAEFVAKKNYEDCDFVISSSIFFEILPKGTSKGIAVEKLKKLLGIEDHIVVAIGDYDNDIEMLEMADISFATANAKDIVKKTADHTLKQTNDENPMTKVIEFVLDEVNK